MSLKSAPVFLGFLLIFGCLAQESPESEFGTETQEKYLSFFKGFFDFQDQNATLNCSEIPRDPLPSITEILERLVETEKSQEKVLNDETRALLKTLFSDLFENGNKCIGHWWKNPEMPSVYFLFMVKKAQKWKDEESKGQKVNLKVFEFVKNFHTHWELLKNGLQNRDFFLIGKWLGARFQQMEDYEMEMLRKYADNPEFFDITKLEKAKPRKSPLKPKPKIQNEL